jgi:DNA-binding FadR family transcriptional regulator
MLTGIDADRVAPVAANPPSDEIEVRRAPDPETAVLAAARAWARAFEAMRRQGMPTGEGAELALYDALAGKDALRSAELALYQAVLTSELTSR